MKAFRMARMLLRFAVLTLCGYRPLAALGAPNNTPLLLLNGSEDSSMQTLASQRQREPAQVTPSRTFPADSGLRDLIEKAKEDLAKRLSIPQDRISLANAASVVWPDSSIGCPQPGMAYLQVPEDGALITLQADGKVYEYHNGGRRGLFLCGRVYKDTDPPPKLDIRIIPPAEGR